MRVSVQRTLALVSAQAPGPADPGGQGEDFGKSSPVGLLLLILFGIAVAFLVRSMSKHLKKLPTTFDEAAAESAAPRRARTTSTASGSDTAGLEPDPAPSESLEDGEADEDTERAGPGNVSSTTSEGASSGHEVVQQESADRTT